MTDLVDEPFYTNALTCKLCLVHCRVEERRKIEKELGCSIEMAKEGLQNNAKVFKAGFEQGKHQCPDRITIEKFLGCSIEEAYSKLHPRCTCSKCTGFEGGLMGDEFYTDDSLDGSFQDWRQENDHD